MSGFDTKCLGNHEKRKELCKKMNEDGPSKQFASHYKNIPIKRIIKPGESKPVTLNLEKLETEFKSTDMWKSIKKGNVLSLPLFEFLQKPDPNTKQNKVPIHQTPSRMDQSLTDKYMEFQNKGLSPEKAEEEMKTNKEFDAYRSLNDERAEVDLKNAIGSTGPSGIVIRSLKRVDVFKSHKSSNHKQDFNKIGLGNPGKVDGEHDLIQIYVDHECLHVNLFEVKRPISYPWDVSGMKRTPSNQSMGKALQQLEEAHSFLKGILADVPKDRIEFKTYVAYPKTPESVLQPMFSDNQVLCNSCYDFVLSHDDLSSSEKLREKLNIKSPNHDLTESEETLLALACSRLVGLTSMVHLGRREPAQVEERQGERVAEITAEVDGDIGVILSPQQRRILAQFSLNDGPRHAVLQGGPGSGKTILLIELARKAVTMVNDRNQRINSSTTNDPVLLVTTPDYDNKNPQLMQYLSEKAKDMGAGLTEVDMWSNLLTKFGGETISPWSDMDVKISELCWAASQTFPDQTIVVMIDEVRGNLAKKTPCKTYFDWTLLDKLPGNVHLLVAFNPDHPLPILLPSDDFCKFQGLLRYRSTIKIIKLVNFISRKDYVDEIATDVDGSEVGYVDAGSVKVPTDLDRTINSVTTFMEEGNITFLCDNYGSDITNWITRLCQDRDDWEVKKWGEFYGCEADRVVYLGCGGSLEWLSRARVKLSVILCYKSDKKNGQKKKYDKYKPRYSEAEKQGFIKNLVPTKLECNEEDVEEET